MKVKLNCITKPMNDMSPEEYIINCSRVSNPENRLNHKTAPKLLKYLITNKHWSPFEMVSIGVEIETSRAIAQQILRHRSFSFQEFSQRYSKVEAMEALELRIQADTNRQSSKTKYTNMRMIQKTTNLILECQEVYEQLINDGVAKESARFILPLTTQTTVIMHGTLRSWLHFLEQRCDNHAQKEIRDIANAIKILIRPNFPWTLAALEMNND